MSNASNNKRPRRNDHKRGLVFDWRGREMFTWRVLWVMLIPAILGGFLFHFVNVKVTTPHLNRSHEEGTVILLNRELTTRALSGTNHSLPVAQKPPIWALPSLGSESDENSLFELGGGIDEYEARLVPQNSVRPQGVRDILLSHLNYPAPRFSPSDDHQTEILMEPAISAASPEMEGWYMDQPRSSQLSGCDGMRTRLWVVVTLQGIPDQVLVYDSSADPEVDQKAVDFIKNLRWLPNGKCRTGSMTVEWKEGVSV